MLKLGLIFFSHMLVCFSQPHVVRSRPAHRPELLLRGQKLPRVASLSLLQRHQGGASKRSTATLAAIWGTLTRQLW